MSQFTASLPENLRRELKDAFDIMLDLRKRCEWDAAQTHQSLRPYLVEEAAEVDDAITSGEDIALRDELGDLLLQVLFHSVIAAERKAFDISDVAGALIKKMRERHPHLYGDGIKRDWESMKASGRKDISEGLASGLPALHRAHRLQDRAAGVGFDWPDVNGPLEKVYEEISEVEELIRDIPNVSHSPELEIELGDLLFSVVNLCRKTGVHAGLALDKANHKFASRFRAMTELAQEGDQDFDKLSLAEQDTLWNRAKEKENTIKDAGDS